MIWIVAILILLGLGGISNNTAKSAKSSDDLLLLMEKGPDALAERRRIERLTRILQRLVFAAIVFGVFYAMSQ